MKVNLLVICVLLGCWACSPSSEPTQQVPTAKAPAATTIAASPLPVDTVRGFGRHHFGDPLRSFPPLTLVHQSRPDLATYQVAAETKKLHFGPVPLSQVLYTFYQSKLYGISLYVPNARALHQLAAEATTRYGPPTQMPEGLVSWNGEQVQISTGHSTDNSGEDYYMQQMSLPLFHQLEDSLAAEQARGY